MVAYDYVFDVLRLTLTPRLTNADTAFIFRIRIIVLEFLASTQQQEPRVMHILFKLQCCSSIRSNSL